MNSTKAFWMVIGILAALPMARANAPFWASAPPETINANQSYTVTLGVWGEGNNLELYKNGSYVAGGSGDEGLDENDNGIPFTVSYQTSDGTGPIEWYGLNWESGNPNAGDVSGTVYINGQPQSVGIGVSPNPATVYAGTAVAFTAYPDGASSLVYQWRKNGSGISGATNSTFTISSPQTGDSGSYSVEVHNSYGSATSSSVTVTVNPLVAPTITRMSSLQSTIEGTLGGALTVKGDGSAWTYGFGSTQSTAFGLEAVSMLSQSGLGTLTTDGSVWWWPSSTFQQVSGLFGTTAIAIGSYYGAGSSQFGLALRSDGTVWAWGNNSSGQLGDGTTTGRSTPVQVSGLTQAVAVAAGIYHSVALKSDGTVWTWGGNANGQLGRSSGGIVGQVSGLSDVVSIAAGYYNTFAIKSDGSVWAWGLNNFGQLGDGTTTQRSTPVQVSGLSGVVSVQGGEIHSIALKGDGTLWIWGTNSYGQFGNGSTSSVAQTTPISHGSGAMAVTVGVGTHAVLKTAGSVWGAGLNGLVQANGISTASVPQRGETVAFAVSATGTPAPTLQWQRKAAGGSTFTNLSNSLTISGATGKVLVVRQLQANMSGDQYRCIATNPGGSATSDPSTLYVGIPYIIPRAPVIAVVGQSISIPLSVVNLTTAWSATGLPSGLSINTTTGTISGTPTTAGVSTPIITASNPIGDGTLALPITVYAVPAMTSSSSTTGVLGTPFTFAVTGSGTPTRFEVTGLPAGLSINPTTGVISGNPMEYGSFSVSLGIANAGASTTGSLSLTVNAAPGITLQPASQTVTVGQALNLSVAAIGVPAPGYQWKKGGSSITGATLATYTVPSVQSSDAGNYTVVVSNSGGSVTSSTAAVTVSTSTSAPSIVVQPVSRTVATGASVGFSVLATGAPPPTYQWKKGGAAISGATRNTFTIASAQSGDAASYTVTVTNNFGAVTSNAAVLTLGSATADSDGDGIPDAVEAALGTNASSAAQSDNSLNLKIQRPPQ